MKARASRLAVEFHPNVLQGAILGGPLQRGLESRMPHEVRARDQSWWRASSSRVGGHDRGPGVGLERTQRPPGAASPPDAALEERDLASMPARKWRSARNDASLLAISWISIPLDFANTTS
jgi:hypothetical protein